MVNSLSTDWKKFYSDNFGITKQDPADIPGTSMGSSPVTRSVPTVKVNVRSGGTDPVPSGGNGGLLSWDQYSDNMENMGFSMDPTPAELNRNDSVGSRGTSTAGRSSGYTDATDPLDGYRLGLTSTPNTRNPGLEAIAGVTGRHPMPGPGHGRYPTGALRWDTGVGVPPAADQGVWGGLQLGADEGGTTGMVTGGPSGIPSQGHVPFGRLGTLLSGIPGMMGNLGGTLQAAGGNAENAMKKMLNGTNRYQSKPITHDFAPVTHAGQRTDVMGNDMAFMPESVQTSSRWNTGY